MKYCWIFTLPLVWLSSILVADSGQPAASPEQSWQSLILIGIAILFFYVVMLRPEQKRRKEIEKKRSGLQKGDRVVAVGMIGEVARVKEESVILRLVEGAKVEVLKSAITEFLLEKGADEEKAT